MKFHPQFFGNYSDDNHCLQASVKMALNALVGETSWDEVNTKTQYEDGLWSWTAPAVIFLSEKIPGTKLITTMDYFQFAERGEEYFREFNKNLPDWFENQKRHASPGFQKEQRNAQKLVQSHLIEQRKLNEVEYQSLLDGNLLISLVNVKALKGMVGSVGHMVLVYGQSSNENILLHDPGLPPQPEWSVPKEKFMSAFQNEVIVIPSGSLRFGMEVGKLERNDPCPCNSGKKYKKCHGR